MLTRDPKTGVVSDDVFHDTARQLFGLGRKKKRPPLRHARPNPRPLHVRPGVTPGQERRMVAPPPSIFDVQPQGASPMNGCCGGYLITHATEPNIYPYEDPKTWVGTMRNDKKNDVMGPGKSRRLTFEDRPPAHPPTYAEALQTRSTVPGLGHHRNGGYLPFERGGLGEDVSSDTRKQAISTFARLATAIPAELEYLSKARPADWDERVKNTESFLTSSYTDFEREVRGKTGDATGEARLLGLMKSISDRARDMRANAPSWLSKTADEFAQWVEGGVAGMGAVYDEFFAWCKAKALEVLKKYHDARVRIIELKNDLKAAGASGKFSTAQLAAQATAIAGAETGLDVASASIPGLGSPLDTFAEDEFGKYPALGFAMPAAAVIALAVAVAIIAAAVLVWRIEKLGGSTGGVIVTGVLVAGAALIAYLMMGKR